MENKSILKELYIEHPLTVFQIESVVTNVIIDTFGRYHHSGFHPKINVSLTPKDFIVLVESLLKWTTRFPLSSMPVELTLMCEFGPIKVTNDGIHLSMINVVIKND